MATSTKSWTRADLERFPDDGNRYEVLVGELLVTPQPSVRHQQIAFQIARRLADHCDATDSGFVVGPAAVTRGPDELQPDVAAFPGERGRDPKWEDLPRPMLVVEVLSPSTRHDDFGGKRAAYLRWGIPEYWIVDIDQREITVVRPGREDERVVETLRWQPRPEIPALEITLAEIFR